MEVTQKMLMHTLLHQIIQGHPESGKLWEKHISKMMKETEFNIVSATHNKALCRGIVHGQKILMFRQVDNFLLASPTEEVAKKG